MLPRNKRISRKIFNEFTRLGARVDSEHFYLRTTNSDTTRIAVSVSKKISKQAVVRNKIRRRTYSAVRELLPHISKKLFLLTAKLGVEKISGEPLKKELAELFLKG